MGRLSLKKQEWKLKMHHHVFFIFYFLLHQCIPVSSGTAVMQQVHDKQLQIVHQRGSRSNWIH